MDAIRTLTAGALSAISLGAFAGEGPPDYPPVRTEPTVAVASRAEVVAAIRTAPRFEEGRYPVFATPADGRRDAAAERGAPTPQTPQPRFGDFSSPFAASYAA